MAKAKTRVSVKTKKGRIKSYLGSYNFSGVVLGSIFMFISFGPSLLPRAWFMQALIAGVNFTIGYGIGVFISHIARQFIKEEPKAKDRNLFKNVVYYVLAASYLLALGLGYAWQKEAHRLVSQPQDPVFSVIGIIIVSALVIMLFIWISRITRTFFRWLSRQIDKVLPRTVSVAFAFVLTGALVIGIINGLLLDSVFKVVNEAFSVRNGTTDEGIERQNSKHVSGSDESLIAWDTLGRQGRKFIGKVATEAALEDFNKQQSTAPVRIYSGLDSANNAKERAALAVADLKRAGGFERDVLVVVTTTGTGWVDEQGVDPVEYMYNGDSAIVAMQYSYLPSWVSFLVDQDKAKEAGIELYNAVYNEWNKLPEAERPTLLSFGESLGSFGSEAAFPTLASFKGTSEGVLWVGPPNSNEIWSNVVPNRDEGTPMILPIVNNGQTVRFAARPDDFNKPTGEWQNPKAVYLQHASDPIVWWGPNLLFNKPDWYNETRGADVSVATRWFPVITFFQISADMAFANGVPDGHGHKYGTLPVDAWSYIAPPEGWNEQKTAELKTLLGS